MREPSIHIKERDLVTILKALDVEGPGSLARDILSMSKKYTLHSRAVTLTTQLAEKKLAKESTDNFALYHEVYKYYSMLVRKHHSFTPKRYKKRDAKMISTLATVTGDIVEFAEMHNMEMQEAIRDYLEVAVSKSNKLAYIAGNPEAIQETWKANKAIGTDTKEAKAMMKIYSDYMFKYTGYPYELSSSTILLKFKKASDWCTSKRIEQEDFIRALFEGLEWKTGIPSPSMFSSDYGIQLVYEYMGKKPTQSSNDGFVSINLSDISND